MDTYYPLTSRENDEEDLELSSFCYDGEHPYCVNGPAQPYGWCRCECHRAWD